MLPACTDESLVCAVYPDSAFEGSHLISAGFQVRLVSETFEDGCVTPEPRADGDKYPLYYISKKHPAERIGNVTFIHGSDVDVAMGSSAVTDYYRAFHRRICYELSVTVSGNNGGADDWGDDPESVRAMRTKKALDERYYRMVAVTLDEVLHSFRFTR